MQFYQFEDAIFVLWLLASLTNKALSISVPQNDRLQVRGVGVASNSVPDLAYSAHSKESRGLTARGSTKYSTRLSQRGPRRQKEPREQNPDRFLRIGKARAGPVYYRPAV